MWVDGREIRVTREDIDRFWSYVIVTNKCWLWTGGFNEKGYGRFKVDGVMVKAHRFSYEVIGKKKIADDQTLDHACEVRECVRYGHLEEVTRTRNTCLAMGLAKRRYTP